MDLADINVLKRILYTLRNNERVLECKIPKMGDAQTISTLRRLIRNEPKYSCFRVFDVDGEDNVCIIRVDNVRHPMLTTRVEQLLTSLSCHLTEQTDDDESPRHQLECSKKPRKSIADSRKAELMMKLWSAKNQSSIPRPSVLDSSSSNGQMMFPTSNCFRSITDWLQSESRVLILCGMATSGKADEIVHHILRYCNSHSKPCRTIYVFHEEVNLLATARRICDSRREMVGSTVGFKLVTNSCISDCPNVMCCTDETMLLALLSDTSKTALAGVTHLIVSHAGRRLAKTDLLLSLVKEKQRIYPLIKLILLTENWDSDDLVRFFNPCSIIMMAENLYQVHVLETNSPFGTEYLFLDHILSHVSRRAEIVEMRKHTRQGNVLKFLADMQQLKGGKNVNCYVSSYLDTLLERCFFARYSCEFKDILELYEAHSHLVDYQHKEIKLTLLMIAAAKGFWNIVEHVLKLGANPYVRSKKGLTAIDWCDKPEGNSCWSRINNACQSNNDAMYRENRLSKLYHRLHNPYVVDHSLVTDVVLYIITKRRSGKILVALPETTDVLQCYQLLRQNEHVLAKGAKFMLLHRCLTEEEVQASNAFPPFTHFLVILMGGQMLEMLPSLDSIDYVVDTGLRVEKVYRSTAGAFVKRVCLGTKYMSSTLMLLAKRTCFCLYTREQHKSMPAGEMPNRNGAGQPIETLYVFIGHEPSSVERFFDSALTPAICSNVTRSIEMLEKMGAIERPLRTPTDLGIVLTYLRIELHLGKALLYAILFKCLDPVLTIVAALSVGDLFQEPTDDESIQQMSMMKRTVCKRSHSDCLVLLRIYQQWSTCKMNRQAAEVTFKYRLKVGIMDAVANVRIQLMTQLRSFGLVKCGRAQNTDDLNKHSGSWTRVKACLTAGFYPNLAKIAYGTQTFRDYNDPSSSLVLHPLSAVTVEELPTNWVIYDHKEDFSLHLQDLESDHSAVHIVENTAITDCMVMLMCGIDYKNEPSHHVSAEADTSTGEECPTGESACQADATKELLLDNRFVFQLPANCYDGVMKLRQEIGYLFHVFVLNPMSVLESRWAAQIIFDVSKILEEEEKAVYPASQIGIGLRPKIKNRCAMGELWNY